MLAKAGLPKLTLAETKYFLVYTDMTSTEAQRVDITVDGLLAGRYPVTPTPHRELCGDCRRRLRTSPLRLLDCKNASCQPLADSAPRTVDAGRAAASGVRSAGVRTFDVQPRNAGW